MSVCNCVWVHIFDQFKENLERVDDGYVAFQYRGRGLEAGRVLTLAIGMEGREGGTTLRSNFVDVELCKDTTLR